MPNFLKISAALAFNGEQFSAGLKKAEAQAAGFASSFGGALKGELAAAFGTAAIVAFTKDAIKSAAAIKDQAEQSRMTTDEVQRLTAAALDAGLAWEDVAMSEKQFSVNRKQAAEGNEELRKTFARYGITLDDLQDPMFRYYDALTHANEAMKGFDTQAMIRSGEELGQMFGARVGPKLAGFVASVEKMRATPIIDPKTIDELDQFGDKITEVTEALKKTVAVMAMDVFRHPLETFSRLGALGGPGGGGGVLNTFAAMRKVFGGGGAYGENNDAQVRDYYRSRGIKNYEDKAAAEAQKKREDEIQREWDKFEAASFNYSLSNASASGKRALLIGRMGESGNALQEAMDNGNDLESVKRRNELLGLLTQFDGVSGGGALPVAGLTKVGQFGGRAMIAEPDPPGLAHIKELLGVNKKAEAALKSIDSKTVKGGVIR